jgi:hypothetical protein
MAIDVSWLRTPRGSWLVKFFEGSLTWASDRCSGPINKDKLIALISNFEKGPKLALAYAPRTTDSMETQESHPEAKLNPVLLLTIP